MKIVSDQQQEDQKAELTLLLQMESLTSQGAKRDFCDTLGVSWDEYLHLKRKYRYVLERFRKEEEDEDN